MSAAKDSNKPLPIIAEQLVEEDKMWLEIRDATVKASVKVIEEAAKQIISLTTFSQGLYFAAISFGDVKKALGLIPSTQHLAIVIALVTPLLFWLVGLYFATRVFVPKIYGMNPKSPDDIKEAYDRIVNFKSRQLSHAHLMLTLGFVPLLINVIGYLLYLPVAPVPN